MTGLSWYDSRENNVLRASQNSQITVEVPTRSKMPNGFGLGLEHHRPELPGQGVTLSSVSRFTCQTMIVDGATYREVVNGLKGPVLQAQ